MKVAFQGDRGYFYGMNILYNVKNGVGFMMGILQYGFLFLRAFFSSRATLAAQMVALRSQLALSKNRIEQKKYPKPKFTPAFRVLWVVLSKVLTGWEDLVALMQPATVKRWYSALDGVCRCGSSPR